MAGDFQQRHPHKSTPCSRAEWPHVQRAQYRLAIIAVMIISAYALLYGRMVLLGLPTMGSDSQRRSFTTAPLPVYQPQRADITDRNGQLLATNVVAYSLCAEPHRILHVGHAVEKLHKILPDISPALLERRLSSGGRFAWIQRSVTPAQYQAVHNLGIPGVCVRQEEQRVYPHGTLAAHLIGYTDIDGQGIAGIEKSMNERLRTKNDVPLNLSMDIRIQHILRESLAEYQQRFSAKAAAGMILHVGSGEVIAMVSLPDFDSNTPTTAPAENRFNQMTLGVYEMGSTFKVFSTALALEHGATPQTRYDARKNIRVGRFTISDYRGKYRWLSLAEVFVYSSNIGTIKMVEQAGGTPKVKQFFTDLGLTSPAKLELSEVGEPLVPQPWTDVSTMTISYGHGISVNGVQLANAMAAVVNGGQFRPATLLKGGNAETPAHAVLSPETSTTLNKILRLNVMEGTGKQANAKGYMVGGKTGTAEKAAGRSYNRKALISSFLAAFPMHNPQYVVLAMLDEPQGTKETYGYATAGWVAAPIVGDVVAKMAPMLGIAPLADDAPEQEPFQYILGYHDQQKLVQR